MRRFWSYEKAIEHLRSLGYENDNEEALKEKVKAFFNRVGFSPNHFFVIKEESYDGKEAMKIKARGRGKYTSEYYAGIFYPIKEEAKK